MELISLLSTLLRKKWIIIACFFIAAFTAYLVTIGIKPLYKSTAQIATGLTENDKLKLQDDRFNTAFVDITFNNIIENFTSPKVVQLLSYDLILHDLKEKAPFIKLTSDQLSSNEYKAVNISQAIDVFQQKLLSYELLDPDKPEDLKLIRFLKLYGYDVESLTGNNIVVQPRLTKTDFLNIDFLSPYPELSSFAVDELVKEFNRYYAKNISTSTGASVATLDSTAKAKKAIYDQINLQKSNYLTGHGIVDVASQSTNNITQISSYQNQLAEEKARLESLNFRVRELGNLIADAKASGKNSVTANKSTLGDNDQYVNLRKEYNALNNEYMSKGSNDPEMKKRIDKLSENLRNLNLSNNSTANADPKSVGIISVDELVQKKLDSDAELRATNERISLIQANLNKLNGGQSTMAVSSADLQRITQELDIASSEYAKAKDKLNAALAISEGSGAFKQTIFGQPALKPEPSKRWIIIFLAGFAGLFLSSLVIILLELIDQSIKTPSQFQRLTQLPLLGTINYIPRFSDNILAEINNIETVEKNRDNTFRELLRKLRYEIENSGKHIFLFTSTEPGQGKTTLIQALSYSLSLGKKKVLIIDTNFCNNDLTKFLAATPVLEKFHVNGNTFKPSDIQSLITKTQVDGIDTIGCGEGDYTPSEILPKDHLLNYLKELVGLYDYIFLEGAPLNNFTDTKELINYCDGLIAVFSSEAKFTSTDKDSIKFLRDHKEKFIGAILNKVKVENIDN